MGTLLVAYLLAWAAASAYLGWLAVQNVRLARRQEELKKMLANRTPVDTFYSNAA